MRLDMTDRIMEEAYFFISTGATVRRAAKVFHLGKSTIHKDMTERLEKVSPDLCKKVKKVLEKNLQERHIRGGEATRRKYLALKNRV